MSWFADPQLFIYRNVNTLLYVHRVMKEFGSALGVADFQAHEQLNFPKHLSMGNIKESGNVLPFDYDAFAAFFLRPNNIYKYINCKGMVIYTEMSLLNGIWSQELPDSPFMRLPGIAREKPAPEQSTDKLHALEGKVSDLEAENSSLQSTVDRNKVEKEAVDKRVADLEAEISRLQAEVNRKRDVAEKTDPANSLAGVIESLQKQNTDLTSKLVLCCGAAAVDGVKVEGVDMLMTMMEALRQQVSELSSKLGSVVLKSAGSLKA